MKMFINPEIAVEKLEVEDVLTVSEGTGFGGNAGLGGDSEED